MFDKKYNACYRLLEKKGKPMEKTIILAHGLSRSPRAMRHIGKYAKLAGYQVAYFGYQSRHGLISEHVKSLRQMIEAHSASGPVHVVTHSLGGIVLRHYLSRYGAMSIDRMVMIAPPHKGSEVIDRYRNNAIFRWWHGPVVDELGTSHAHPAVDHSHIAHIGIIAGNRSQPILGRCFSSENDGKVSVESARLEGVSNFVVLPFTHTNMLWKEETAEYTLQFLASGKFHK